MAVNWPVVYLGYVDEVVSEKYAYSVDFTTNKIGGNPNWPCSGITVPNCPDCGLVRPLILQIYAPLEGSQFHRTLYVFACLNCSIQSSSWFCVRSQTLEKNFEKENARIPQQGQEKHTVNVNWCAGANDWDVPEDTKTADAENCNEENGNTISKIDKLSDEDDESNSTEIDLLNIIENVHIDERNANSGAQEGGAAAMNNAPKASAEIETDETELIIIDTPDAPQRDLIALFKQNNVLSSDQVNLTLRSFFLTVDEEAKSTQENTDHIRDLIQEYQKKDDDLKKSPEGASACEKRGELLGDGEHYEKGIPAHGDLMFHAFITRIQENPGQVIRYSRNTVPLLINYLKESIPKCTYCGSDLICEIQVLPTIIPHLQLENCDATPIEFGTVLIYTCSKSCWDTPDKMRIEVCIVQQET